MAAAILVARQHRADLDKAIHTLKAEARKLMAVASKDRKPEQTARLDAIDLALDAKNDELGLILHDIAKLERMQADEIAQAPPANVPTVARATGRKVREMWPGLAINLGGFNASEEYYAAIHAGLADPRLISNYMPQPMRAVSTGTVDSEGGFSVPTQVWAEWLDSSLESEIVRSRADIRPMITSEALAPAWDDGDHTSELYGGFTGQWLEEGGDITPQTPNLRLIRLKARKLALLTAVSNELIADGVGFDAQLGMAMPKACSWFLDKAFLRGNGANQPMGILNAACTITVAKETGQPAASILYENLTKMFARLHPASYPNAVWVCNATAIPKLLQLSIAIGVGGSHIPVLSESGGKFKILTLPCVFTEKMPALGTKGDILLADFSQYVVGLRADFSLAKSAHVYFGSDKTAYRGIIRIDGQPKLSAPITPFAGDTLSPFVVLADRA